jgi:hypothetical protein
MDAFIQLDKVASKRSALEKLIAIAIGIQSQQQSMEDLALIAKPSQDLPAKTVQHLLQFESQYADRDDDELRQQLDRIEAVIHTLIDKVIGFVQLEVSALRDEELKGLTVDGFTQLVEHFEQRTQSSLILRFLLKKRGVALPAFKLPFSQDAIAERIDSLREKESHCIVQIKAEAQSIIDDTRTLLAGSALPDKMRQQLQLVQQEMQDNLVHLDSGGSVATLPNKFEVVSEPEPAAPLSTDEPPPRPVSAPPEPKVVKAATAPPIAAPKAAERSAATQPVRRKKLTGMQLLMKWLTTPWGRSWRSLKEENDKLDR